MKKKQDNLNNLRNSNKVKQRKSYFETSKKTTVKFVKT